jgi:hypothetical protein
MYAARNDLPPEVRARLQGATALHYFNKFWDAMRTDRLKPCPNIVHAESCSSRALASFKSSVSKPSVNQP